MIEFVGENFFPAVNAIIKLANCAKKRNSSLKESLNKQKKSLHQLINTPIKLIILTILLPAKIILFFNFALVNKKSYNFFMDFNSEFESICGWIKLHLSEEEKKELLAQLQKIVNWVSELEKWPSRSFASNGQGKGRITAWHSGYWVIFSGNKVIKTCFLA